MFAQIVMTLLALVDCAAVVYVLFTGKRSFYDRMIYTLIIFLLPFAGAAFAAYKHYYWLKSTKTGSVIYLPMRRSRWA